MKFSTINFTTSFTTLLKTKPCKTLVLQGFFNFRVGPLGLEPRLFYTKNRRVASYTMGQLWAQSYKEN